MNDDDAVAPLPYTQYLSLPPADSLMLGIEGFDDNACATRLDIATKLHAQYEEIDEAAYAAAHWMNEPDTPMPFGLNLIIDHHGDVLAALEDDRLRGELSAHLGYEPCEIFIRDEDGDRWEWYDGGANDPSVQQEIDANLLELKATLTQAHQHAALSSISQRWSGTPTIASDANAERDAADVTPDTIRGPFLKR